jgi:hypothetical protein
MKVAPDEGRFLKGTRIRLSKNSDGSIGGDDKMITPIQSNEIYCPDFNLPSGDNKTIGSFEFRELNEVYWFVWNNNGNHSINMIDGSTETCTSVFIGDCLNFSLDPKYAIPEHRALIRVQYDEVDGVRIVKEKYLIFTDGANNVRQINVFASIGSNSFTLDYFKSVYPHNSCCDFITLAPIAPMYRPSWELIQRAAPTSDESYDTTPNKLFNRAIQIAYQFVYVDGRQSSISPYGKPIIVGGTDCFEQNPDSLPRCAELSLWVGNAFVEKINIYFRECTTCVTGNCDGNWFLYDTIEKFNCQEDKKWWERTGGIWEQYEYEGSTNTITYLFCADKQCTPIDQSIFTHIENEVPFKSMAITPIGDRVGLYNNLRHSENLTCEGKDSFSISVTEQPDETCVIPKRKITVYMIIRNESKNYNGDVGNECQFLFGDSGSGTNKPISGKFYFGGFGWRKHPVTLNKKVAVDDFWIDYKQYVPADAGDGVIGGFIGYLAGTNYVSVSKQVKLYSDCTIEESGIVYEDIANMFKNNGSFDSIVEALKDGEYVFLQKFEFEDVPSGRYVFRVAGHRTGYSVGFEKTSTYISGIELLECTIDGDAPFTPAITRDYELIIDVCEYDYNSLQEGLTIRLLDLTLPSFTDQALYVKNRFDYNLVSEVYLFEDDDYSVPFESQTLTFEYGYFKDRITGIEHDLSDGYLVPNPYNIPLLIPASDVENTSTTRVTDHNGFVFVREQFYRIRTLGNLLSGALYDFTSIFTEPKLGEITITYVNGCGTASLDPFVVGPSQVIPNVSVLSNKGYRGLKGTVSKSTNTYENPCNRVTIRGTIMDLDGNRLSGINVGFTGGQFVRTDGFGIFNVIAHNNITFNKDGWLIISNAGGGCNIVCNEDCLTCCDDMFDGTILLTCSNATDIEDCPQVIIDKGTYYFKKVNFPDKGLKGRYGFGVVGWDCFGRIVTGGVNNISYIDTPECWSKHPIISWSWDGTPLNKEIKYLTFFRTKNLNGSILQWIADKFILIDGDGNETSNKGQAVAVAVDMTSLLDYNRQHNLNTLVDYSFVKGDVLRIISDCEKPIQYIVTGTTFGTVEPTALQQELQVTVNDTTATSKTNVATDNGGRIIIPYDSRIDDYLDSCNVKIEIVRPYQCVSSLEPYCEISDVYPVVDGEILDVTSGVLETWDTYKIFRNIPNQLACENNPSDDPYFSNNITDFWGQNCTDCGRKLSENPYAQRIWMDNEFALSKSFVNNGVVNGLGTFWNEDTKNFKNQNWGAGVAVNAQRGVLFFICENDFFITNYNQNYLRATADGFVQATPQDTIGEPNVKVGMNYGCSFEDTSTIVFFENNIFWLDSKNQSLIKSDYNSAIDISIQNNYKSFIVNKTQYVKKYNESIKSSQDYLYNLIEIVAGVCPLNNEYHLTFRPRMGLSQNTEYFVNNQREVLYNLNETLAVDLVGGVLINFRHYTPEFYAKLRTSNSGIQLISFYGGKAWKHNGGASTYNNFYGVQTSPVIEFCANMTDSKVKIFQSLSEEIQPFALYVDRVYTEEKNSYSYIPYSVFKKKENIQYAEFMRDMSSYFDPNKYQLSMLIDGKRIFGRVAVIRLTTTGEHDDKFFKLSRIWVLFSGSELSLKPQVAT